MRRRTLLACGPVVLLTGCLTDVISRSQKEDAPPPEPAVRTVGDVAVFDNAAAQPVGNVGLVVGLDGRGAPTPAGPFRTLLEDRLKKAGLPAHELLNSKDTALVTVSAVIPPGARRGDHIDVEVALPANSKVKSLRGGVLLPTPLRSYSTKSEVRSALGRPDDGLAPIGGGGLLLGHELAAAKGPLQSVVAKDRPERKAPDDDDGVKSAFVWRGAKCLDHRAYYIVLNTDEQSVRLAKQMSDRLNDTFPTGDGGIVSEAKPQLPGVALAVPPQYRLNLPHFLRVVKAVPLARPEIDSAYVKKYADELLRPETALTAALRLEALGTSAVPLLKKGLTHESPVVRFAAAEALAYLGHAHGAPALAKVAVEHPSLQAYALTALASLDEAACTERLVELLDTPEHEVRYGAFRALQELGTRVTEVRSQQLKSFVLAEASTQAGAFVHLLSGRRSEVVIFGDDVALRAPFAIPVGTDMTVTAKAGDSSCTISRFRLGSEPAQGSARWPWPTCCGRRPRWGRATATRPTY